MIGWLRGEVLALEVDGTVTLNVGDVGYEVLVPTRLLSTVAVGATVELFVHTRVKDESIVLYGFSSATERSAFELLLAAPGVGPSTALGALSTLTTEELAAAVEGGDVARLATVPGVGKKTAARLVLELSGKLPTTSAANGAVPDLSSDVVAALRQLGYSAGEIREGLRDVELPNDEEAALRLALRQLGRV